ncbi:MAG TPA: 1-phosphofructokinase [Firmicutes bacterium]|nr:1-phosphofructokinase [Bacillota bacterium]
MVVTVTFNPALDYIVYLPELRPGSLGRAVKETIVPGGKGLNVSVVLANLGIPNRALGFTAGFTGAEIRRLMETAGCETDFISLPSGFSRINVKVKAQEESEINGRGPEIGPKELEALYRRLDALQEGDFLVLAGSIPGSLPEDLYDRILLRLQGKGVETVVDAAGELLLRVLPHHPFLIKPNHLELGELFSRSLSSREEVAQYARLLQKQGARNVLVSMAGDGACLVTETGDTYFLSAPQGKVVNSVGAGDSMLAGFLAGWLQTGDYAQAMRLGVASGSATAFQEWLASREEIQALLAGKVMQPEGPAQL